MQEKPSCSAVRPRLALGAFLLLWLEAVGPVSFVCGLVLRSQRAWVEDVALLDAGETGADRAL